MRPYWERDGITLWLGDARDVLPTLERVDHCITDPPYEAEAHTKGRRTLRGSRPGHSVMTWRDARGQERIEALDFPAIDDDLRAAAAQEIARLVSRWVLVFAQAEGAHKWECVLRRAGLSRRRWCIWVKPDGQPQFSGDRPGVGYETIVACHAVGRSTWNGGGRVGVFTHVKNVTGSQRAAFHQTEKPLPLMRELVTLFTDPGDLILDPFAGSGTTLVAAYGLGRRAIGVEIEEKYAEVAAKRLEGCIPPLPLVVAPPAEQGAMPL